MIGRRLDGAQLFYVALLVLLPITSLGYAQVSFGLVAAVFAYPMLATSAWRVPQFRVLALLTLGTLISAPILAWYITFDPNGRGVNGKAAFHDVVIVITALALVATILAASRWLSPAAIIAYVSVGLILQQAIDHTVWKGNPWKYAFALPVAFLVLLCCRRLSTSIIALAVLAAISSAYDYRSFFGFALFSIIVVIAFRRIKFDAHPGRYILAMVAVTLAVLQLYEWLSINGFLGAEIKARTAEQAASGQSLLVVARPEWRATLHLMSVRPLGFTPGLEANASDVYSVLAHLGPGATNSTYVSNYLLGDGGIGLHSTLADEWLKFGVFGFALIAYMAYVLARRLAEHLSAGHLSVLDAFLPVTLLWDVLFSPESALTRIALGVGIAMLARSVQPEAAGDLHEVARRGLIRKLEHVVPASSR